MFYSLSKVQIKSFKFGLKLLVLLIVISFFQDIAFAQVNYDTTGNAKDAQINYDPNAKVKTYKIDSLGVYKEVFQDSVWTIGLDGKLKYTRSDSVLKSARTLNYNPRTGEFEQLTEDKFQKRKAYFDSLAKGIFRFDSLISITHIFFYGTIRSIKSLSPAEYKMYKQDSIWHSKYAKISDSLQKASYYKQRIRDLEYTGFPLFPFSISIKEPQTFIQHIYLYLSKEKKWVKVNFGKFKNNPSETIINIYDPKLHPSKLVFVGSDGTRIFSNKISSSDLKPLVINPITLFPSSLKKLNEVLKID